MYWCALLVILLTGAEGGARLVNRLLDRRHVESNVYWRRRWVRTHDKVTEIYYSFDRFDATKGWISKPNLRHVPVFTGKSLSTNALGLRGTRDYTPGPVPGKRRLLVLGDSFTFGDGVSDDETYAHRLQQLLPDYEVMNFGVHGYGHDQMLLLLREVGLKYQPDIVVVGFIDADMIRNVLYFRDYAKPRFGVANGALIQLTGSIPPPAETAAGQWWRSGLVDFVESSIWMTRSRLGRIEQEVRIVTQRLLREIQVAAEEAGATSLFFYLPWGGELRPPHPTPRRWQFLEEFCRTFDANCATALPAFAAEVRKGKDFGASHWDAEGHRVAAAALSHAVRDLEARTRTSSRGAGSP